MCVLFLYRSLRISTPHSDSACSSSAESSDCESTTHPQLTEAPVEIVPGLFLGNASHSEDARALQKYNIKYVLNVTPDLPNVFESSGNINYLQIPITDHWSQDLAVHFPTAINFIGEFFFLCTKRINWCLMKYIIFILQTKHVEKV